MSNMQQFSKPQPNRRPKAATEPEHGKASTYRYYKCRCDECRAANATQAKIDRATRLANPIPSSVHGTMNGYGNYNCRCDKCRRANSVYNQGRKATR